MHTPPVICGNGRGRFRGETTDTEKVLSTIMGQSGPLRVNPTDRYPILVVYLQSFI